MGRGDKEEEEEDDGAAADEDDGEDEDGPAAAADPEDEGAEVAVAVAVAAAAAAVEGLGPLLLSILSLLPLLLLLAAGAAAAPTEGFVTRPLLAGFVAFLRRNDMFEEGGSYEGWRATLRVACCRSFTTAAVVADVAGVGLVGVVVVGGLP